MELQDRLTAERRDLPWVRIDEWFDFDTAKGKKTLTGLFDGHSQLFGCHFMFGPNRKQGCLGCSFFADHVDGPNMHLRHHDVTVTVVSRGPLPKTEAYRKRMGWKFNWASSEGGDFNCDFHVSVRKEDLTERKACSNFGPLELTMQDLSGIGAFYKDESGTLFHTDSAYAHGDERGLGAYMFLDMTPKGRNENGPHYNLTE
jgi:predicted dithiol-disulfide oxidoreductase (DUF899 family)